MLVCDGRLIKRNGVYDEIVGILRGAGKQIIEFSGIMPNSTYAKVQGGGAGAREQSRFGGLRQRVRQLQGNGYSERSEYPLFVFTENNGHIYIFLI